MEERGRERGGRRTASQGPGRRWRCTDESVASRPTPHREEGEREREVERAERTKGERDGASDAGDWRGQGQRSSSGWAQFRQPPVAATIKS